MVHKALPVAVPVGDVEIGHHPPPARHIPSPTKAPKRNRRKVHSNNTTRGGGGCAFMNCCYTLICLAIAAAVVSAVVFPVFWEDLLARLGINVNLDGSTPTPAPTFQSPTKSPVVCQYEVNEPIHAFNDTDSLIALIFTVCPNPDTFDAFMDAAERWSLIVDNPIVGTHSLAVDTALTTVCGFMAEEGFTVPSSLPLDKLFIYVQLVSIDGAFNIVGQAAPCKLTGGLPILGGMLFDTADIDRLVDDGDFSDVALHEMGHVLGLGTLWDRPGNVLLANPLFTGSTFNPSGNPRYTGSEGIAAYASLGKSGNVPLEDFKDATETDGLNVQTRGRGSVDAHWDIDDFRPEVMTFRLASGVSRPLSVVTIRSLRDLGYTISDSQLALADPITLPGARGVSTSHEDDIDLSGDTIVFTAKELEDMEIDNLEGGAKAHRKMMASSVLSHVRAQAELMSTEA